MFLWILHRELMQDYAENIFFITKELLNIWNEVMLQNFLVDGSIESIAGSTWIQRHEKT